MRRAAAVAIVVLALPAAAAAQGGAAAADPELAVGAAPRRPEQLDPAQPLTLRPERALRPLAQRVARTLALRAQIEVTVGDPPPPIVEAVPCAHVGMVREGAELIVAFGGPAGMIYTSRVDLPAARDAAVRAVALAVEALRDAAIEGPPPPAPGAPAAAAEGARERVSYVYLEQEGGLFGVRRRVEPNAHPVIYLRVLLGFSTARSTALVGPGVGLGLCIDMSCLVIEGDLPLIPEERHTSDGTPVYYRPISFGMRVGLRPWRWGDFVPALVLGVLTRFGNAWIADVASQTVTDFGLRGSLELAWIFAAPFELVFELGVDFIANPAEFTRTPASGGPFEVVFLEDVVTLWGVMSVRLRP